jgi:hypothetical protein
MTTLSIGLTIVVEHVFVGIIGPTDEATIKANVPHNERMKISRVSRTSPSAKIRHSGRKIFPEYCTREREAFPSAVECMALGETLGEERHSRTKSVT